MHYKNWMISTIVGLCTWFVASGVLAAGRVQLIVAADRDAPLVSQQTWARELGNAGVNNVRIQQQRSSDGPGIKVRGTKASPLYIVTGVLDSRGDLVLPEGRYRRGQAARVAKWLNELARLGPPESREPVVAFGLPRSQMMAVRGDLAAPVGFSTLDQPRSTVIRKMVDRLKLPVHMDRSLLPAGADDRVKEELSGLTCGTALACVLRPAGLVLVPRMAASGPEYLITTARGQRESWPVGWKPEQRVTDAIPSLFKLVPVSLENVPVSQAIDAIAKRLDVPVLLDHAAITRHNVKLDKPVSVPKKRTSYNTVLGQVLFKAMLKHEPRADESGRPFLWITTAK